MMFMYIYLLQCFIACGVAKSFIRRHFFMLIIIIRISNQFYRHCWQRLHATQLFVEHVIQKHPTVDIKVPARRLTRVIFFTSLKRMA